MGKKKPTTDGLDIKMILESNQNIMGAMKKLNDRLIKSKTDKSIIPDVLVNSNKKDLK
jgi:hypothetical protein